MDLSVIFHEKQEQGSMLCAQHALNNLLQSNLYSASELSNIGHELDELEAEQLDADQALEDRMGNVDDSGFFSVGVIEKALQVVGLRLVRWESQDMQPYHNNPEHQSAFVFNFKQHWFCMRKFGDSPDFWFNLNSFFDKPERVSQLYLGLQIHQSQREGYSVFAVLPSEDSPVPLGSSFLPQSPADDYFISNSHLAFASFASPSNAGSSRPAPRKRSDSPDSNEPGEAREAQRRRITPAGSDEEEEMMRRAIEASMADVGVSGSSAPPPDSASSSQPRGYPPAARPFQALEDELSAALENSHMHKANNSRRSEPVDLNPSDHEHDGKTESEAEAGDEDDSDQDEEPTLDELRRRRLARFS